MEDQNEPKPEQQAEPAPVKKKKGGRPGQGYPHRLLQALATIYEDDSVDTTQKLQALRLSVEVLPMRKIPKKKTDKEKAILEALKPKKKGEPKPTPSSSTPEEN